MRQRFAITRPELLSSCKGKSLALEIPIKSPTRLDSEKQLPLSSATAESHLGETVLGLGSIIRGELHLAGHSTIEGQVEGEIFATGVLVIASTAKVLGNIKASELVVKGFVEGEIICSEKLELATGSNVQGRIESPRLIIHDGVRFDGQCSMPDGGISAQSSLASGIKSGSLASSLKLARTAN